MSRTRLVYSTEGSNDCPRCGNPLRKCQRGDPAGAGMAAGDGVVRIRRERKGRAGKDVTVINGLPLDAKGLKAQARILKSACGSGGSIKDGEIEIQGDHREKIKTILEKQGLNCRLAGG